MEIRIKLNGRKLVACKKCGVYSEIHGKKKKKGLCNHCTNKVATVV
ncbi:hypothetical protein ACN6MT_11455 [Neobacillus niacini]